MKRRDDPRHLNRVSAVKLLFEKSFREDAQAENSELASKVLENQKEIDQAIAKYAPAWPILQVAPIDLAILRLAIYELLFKKEPEKVIVDEAVEIAKEYGNESSGSFINGVLGAVIKSKEQKVKKGQK